MVYIKKADGTKQKITMRDEKNKKRKLTQDGVHRTEGYYGRFGIPKVVNGKPEKKFYDQRQVLTAMGSGGEPAKARTTTMVNIPQGTSASQRIGRSLTVKSIHIRGHFVSAVGAPYDMFRLIVFLDQQCNGAVAQYTDLLEVGVDNANIDCTSFLNLSNSKRFKILRDFHGGNNSGIWNSTAADFGTQFVSFNENINVDIPIEYSSTTGAIAEIKSNNIGMFFIGYRGSGTGAGSVQYYFRVRYTDN